MNLRLIFIKGSHKLRSYFINLVAHETNHDIQNTVLLIGTTRSGTTYLMENLNRNNEYRLIFEPFSSYTTEWKPYEIRQYIDSESTNPKLDKTIDEILSGKIHNRWTDQYNRKIRSTKRLIKAVRANLMVAHIRKIYPELPIIYIVRSPKEVVASRLNLGFDQNDVFDILEQKEFLSQHFSDVDFDQLKSILTTSESKHTALWCLENRHLLENYKVLKLYLIKYEETIGKLITYKDGDISITAGTSSPSASSTSRSKRLLSKTEKTNVNQILRIFQMEKHGY